MRDIIHARLEKSIYHPEQTVIMTKSIADEIRGRLKGKNNDHHHHFSFYYFRA
jgi:hypothetical protein